jgi:hypothetical protein
MRKNNKKLLCRQKYYDTIAAMMRKVKHTGRIAFLLLYVIYALTPIYMYAMAGGSNERFSRLLSTQHAAKDIVWANVLFSSLNDEVEAPSTGAHILSNAQQSGEMVLVKKRRALVREQLDVRPLFDTKTLSPGGVLRPLMRSLEYEIAKDPLLRETESCLVLNTGLSPPFLFS